MEGRACSNQKGTLDAGRVVMYKADPNTSEGGTHEQGLTMPLGPWRGCLPWGYARLRGQARAIRISVVITTAMKLNAAREIKESSSVFFVLKVGSTF